MTYHPRHRRDHPSRSATLRICVRTLRQHVGLAITVYTVVAAAILEWGQSEVLWLDAHHLYWPVAAVLMLAISIGIVWYRWAGVQDLVAAVMALLGRPWPPDTRR